MTAGCAQRFAPRPAVAPHKSVFPVRTRGVLLGQISIIDRPNDSPFVFFHVAASANPFRAQRRQTLFDIAVKIGIGPWAARVVNAHRLVYFDFAVRRLGRRERDFPERNANVRMQFAVYVNLFGIWKLVAAAADRGFRGPVPITGGTDRGYRSAVILFAHKTEKPCAIARTADIPSPASDPRSLRRHYPHQVQGVSSITPDSQPLRLPRSLLLGQNRTRASEVN